MKYIYNPSDFGGSRPQTPRLVPRVYFDLEGVLVNFTTRAALALDNMHIPIAKDGILSPSPVYNRTTNEVLYDICHGFDFYKSLPKYPWSDIIFSEAFMATKENVYFISRQNMWDRESWAGKAQWVWENYGQFGYDHLVMVSDNHDLSHRGLFTPGDILIDDMLEPNIKRWCMNGGTGFHWPEIDPRAEDGVITKELYQRISTLKTLIGNT